MALPNSPHQTEKVWRNEKKKWKELVFVPSNILCRESLKKKRGRPAIKINATQKKEG
jgi:hypothetical protein